ncbi:MAG: tetratricopeptide repeat protein [Xenococcaceae cyanobacterium]
MNAETKLKLQPENYRNYQKLLGQIEASAPESGSLRDGILSLLIAVCDDKYLRNRLINAYEAELKPQIHPYRLQLDGDEPSLRMAIAQLVQTEEYLHQGGRAVLTVTGADELLFISPKAERTEQDKFFGYLQWTREGLLEFPYPIVLWVTNQILVKLSEKAPDFWSWRKGVFRFVSETPMVTIPPENVERHLITFEETDNNFLPLEDLQGLIARTEQKRGKKDPILATLYDRLGELYRHRLERGEVENYPDERECALQCFRKAITLQTELGLRSDLVNSLRHLGLLYYFQAQYQEAIDCHQKSLKIAQEIGDRQGEANSLGNLGNAYDSLGQYQRAIEFHQQSLEIAREIGDRQGEANSLGNLGLAYYSLGQYQRAIEFHQQYLEIAREIGDRQGEANSLGNLGIAYKFLGQYQRAIEFHQQTLEIAREIGDRQGEAKSLVNLGLA